MFSGHRSLIKNKTNSSDKHIELVHFRKTEHFKALAKNDNTSAIADHVKATGHNIKSDHFDILAKGKTDYHCKIIETLFTAAYVHLCMDLRQSLVI